MRCKTIYSTRSDALGRIFARAELVADTAHPAMPASGKGIEGMVDGLILDDGSRLTILETGAVHVLAAGEWYELRNAGASGVLEVSEPGTYDVSDKAVVVVKEGGTS